jgi:2-polyprenyl-6-hydroxyphenyl methylase / 3-demethylubiquinone-9 3-methyltransferase
MKSKQELKQLHGDEYVEAFEKKLPMRLERLLDYMRLDMTLDVADFACGNAILMELIAPGVRSYTGVDFSEPFIRAANEKKERLSIPNAQFICADINAFCACRLNTFDVAFAMDVSEHIYDEEWLAVLKSIKSSLKPNGRLYLHTPNAEFFLERMKDKGLIVKQFPEHIAVRTPAHNVAMLREAGFGVARIRLIAHYNIMKIVHPLSFLPLIGKFFKARIFIEATA